MSPFAWSDQEKQETTKNKACIIQANYSVVNLQ
jgi:hypothetical protein